MQKDWNGNSKSVYSCLGATNHSEEDRQAEDFYATEPKATKLLLENEKFSPIVYEPACGAGHMAEVLKAYGYKVIASDLIDRGYGDIIDFLKIKKLPYQGDIITNPPYKYAKEFIEKSLSLLDNGYKVAMFLKLTFMESKGRKELFAKSPFKTLYVSSGRLQCAKNGDFEKYSKGTGTAIAYGWYVWEKGYKGDPVIKWIN